MGACYSHIDFKERVKLFDLAKAGILSIDEIARILGRHRSAPRFEAPNGPYTWLERSLFLCSGARLPEYVLQFFEVS